MKSKIRIVCFPTFAIFLIMLLYESTKELIFKGGLAPWESHWITILFTTIVSFVVAMVTVSKNMAARKKEESIRLKEEKLKSIKQIMHVVMHHVNNLSNGLCLIDFEIKQNGSVSKDTLELLNKSIQDVTSAMQHLGTIDDPYNDDEFKI